MGCSGLFILMRPLIVGAEGFVAIYALSDLGLEVSSRIFFYGLEVVGSYEVLDFCVVLFSR